MNKELIYGKCINNRKLYAQAGTSDFFHAEKCKKNCLPINVKEVK